MLFCLAGCGGGGSGDPVDAYTGTWMNSCVQPLFSPVFRQDVLVISKTGPATAAVTVRHNTYLAAGCSGAANTSTATAGTLALHSDKALGGVQWNKARFTFPDTTRLELVARDGSDLLLSVQLEVIEQPNTGTQQRDAEGYPAAFDPLPGPVRLRPMAP